MRAESILSFMRCAIAHFIFTAFLRIVGDTPQFLLRAVIQPFLNGFQVDGGFLHGKIMLTKRITLLLGFINLVEGFTILREINFLLIITNGT